MITVATPCAVPVAPATLEWLSLRTMPDNANALAMTPDVSKPSVPFLATVASSPPPPSQRSAPRRSRLGEQAAKVVFESEIVRVQGLSSCVGS